MHEQLRAAIDGKRLIELTYDGKRRIVEPHDYGVHKGVEKVLIYQLRPQSAGRRDTRWRTLEVAKILNAVVLDQSFPGSRGRADQKHVTWDVLTRASVRKGGSLDPPNIASTDPPEYRITRE